jgi:predicted GH43/DUF377 family glycosyl hydrolase
LSIFRSPYNPIIKPEDIKPSRDDFEVIGVFNTAVTRLEDEIVLLLRVAERPISRHPNILVTAVYDVNKRNIITQEFSKDDREIDLSDHRLIKMHDGTYLTSISHLRIARSKDGVKFEIGDRPAIAPANEYETFGIEDPRISFIGGTYFIDYVAVSPLGVTTCLACTKDFITFEHHGVIFCPENKDAAIFPERIDGKFYAMHRPDSPLFKRNEIWLAESPDLLCWGNHRYLMGTREGYWDEAKIGAGAVPFRIDEGWLEIYHGADSKNRYCLGAVLLDNNEPWKIIARSDEPILEPTADYECEGFFGNVVFSCGLLFENEKLNIYYGASDTVVCLAEVSLEAVFKNLNL